VKKSISIPYQAELLPPAERFFQWAKKHARPTLLERDQECRFDRRLWESLGALGLFQPDQDLRTQLECFIGLGAGSMDIPFALSAIAHGAVAVELLARFGSEAQRARFLPDMVAGTTIAAVCNAEASGGTDVKAIGSRLELSDDGRYRLHLNKRGATNLSFADVIFASAWRPAKPDEKKPDPSLEVVLVSARELSQESHVAQLAGFRTGLTGSVRTMQPLSVRLSDVLLGGERVGFQVLKHCFNIERIFIPAILIGILDGMLAEATELITSRQSFGKPLTEYQYVQEKIITIYAARERTGALIDSILNSAEKMTKADLAEHGKLLSLLKMTAVEEAFAAATAFYELSGYVGYRLDHLAQKILRDLLGLKMLGGTKEQQKIILFQELMREHGLRAAARKGTSDEKEPA